MLNFAQSIFHKLFLFNPKNNLWKGYCYYSLRFRKVNILAQVTQILNPQIPCFFATRAGFRNITLEEVWRADWWPKILEVGPLLVEDFVSFYKKRKGKKFPSPQKFVSIYSFKITVGAWQELIWKLGIRQWNRLPCPHRTYRWVGEREINQRIMYISLKTAMCSDGKAQVVKNAYSMKIIYFGRHGSYFRK